MSLINLNKTSRQNLEDLLQKHPELQIPHDQYNINVTTENGKNLEADSLLHEFAKHSGSDQEAHLYFHLPLCNYICKFCNYVKRKAPKGEALLADLNFWVSAWQKEALYYLKNYTWVSKAPIHSVYFGGGTAALLQPSHLDEMVQFIRSNYNLQPNAEITLEGNPDNFSKEYLNAAVKSGFNRFSVGVQSLNNNVLQFSGRGHSAEMAIESIRALTELGFPFNVDIMFGLPHQSPATAEKEIQQLIDLGVPTITIYRLRNADREKMGIGNKSAWNNGVLLAKMELEGVFPSLESTYEMRSRIVNQFEKAGYEPSPCGWWSKPGVYQNGNIPKVSKSKWENYNTMLAYGPGVYGWLTDQGSKAIQTHNITDIHQYRTIIEEGRIPLSQGKVLSDYASLATRLGFGLKANQPIQISEYLRRYGVDLFTDPVTSRPLRSLVQKGLVEFISDNHFKLSADGEALHEEIISIYIHNQIGKIDNNVCNRVVVNNV